MCPLRGEGHLGRAKPIKKEIHHMKNLPLSQLILIAIFAFSQSESRAQSGAHHQGTGQGSKESYRSPYAGQENRQIKSLSANDIQELKRGGGWGLAKAAELNGLPGPAQVDQRLF